MPADNVFANYTPVKTISLKNHPAYNEAWVQQVIFEHPELLGIGNVKGKDKEVQQPAGGRLDLLLQDEEAETRYEVEVQLGATDESHIIRTIEYWDVERKRYPNKDHIAVIVAEEITARFFNVISLFNSAIPLIALKMTAIEYPDGKVGLLFTKVLDLIPKLTEDDEPTELVDEAYWKKRATKQTVQLAKKYLDAIRKFEPQANFSFNKFYLGIWVAQHPRNFVVMRPKKQYVNIDIRLESSAELDEEIAASDFDVDYKRQEGRYRLQVNTKTSEKGFLLVEKLMKMAYDNYG